MSIKRRVEIVFIFESSRSKETIEALLGLVLDDMENSRAMKEVLEHGGLTTSLRCAEDIDDSSKN